MLQLFITDALILLAKYTMHVVLIFGSGIILLSFSASLHIDISTLAANFFELEKKNDDVIATTNFKRYPYFIFQNLGKDLKMIAHKYKI